MYVLVCVCVYITYIYFLFPSADETPARLLCMECGNVASDFSSHYPASVSCLLCPYSTFCSCAYASHMIQ